MSMNMTPNEGNKMFEYSEDTALLHGALISSQRTVALLKEDDSTSGLCNASPDELKIIGDSVSNTVNFILENSDEYEDISPEILKQRVHAVLFYIALRSAGIISDAADEYYESVVDVFPELDWKVYVEVLSVCHWRDQMIECLIQLPSTISEYVLQAIFCQCKDQNMYILDSVFQCAIYILFNIKQLKSKETSILPFNFSFVMQDKKQVFTADVENGDAESANSVSFTNDVVHISGKDIVTDTVVNIDNSILICDKSQIISNNAEGSSVINTDANLMNSTGQAANINAKNVQVNAENIKFGSDIIHSANISDIFNDIFKAVISSKNTVSDIAKFVFHGLLTIFDNAASDENSRTIFLKSDAVENYIFFICEYFRSSVVKNELKFAFAKFSTKELKVLDQTIAFSDIHVGYIFYITYNKWKELHHQLKVFSNIQLIFKMSCNILNTTLDELFSLHPLNNRQDLHFSAEYMQMLMLLIDNGYKGVNYALEYILTNPSLLQKNDVLLCLERNYLAIAHNFEYVVLLMDAIMKNNYKERSRVASLLINIYNSIASSQIRLLEIFISEYGPSTKLKLSSFDYELSTFISRAVSLKQAQCTIAKLCLQSPHETVKKIVERAIECKFLRLVQVLVQSLKYVSCICCYQKGNNLQLLIQVLQPYFQPEKLAQCKLQNIIKCIKELFEAFSDIKEFSYSQFLLVCVLQNFRSSSSADETAFYIKIINIVLSHSLKIKNIDLLKQVNPAVLFMLLCRLIDFCLKTFNPELKEIIISTLDTMLQLQSLASLRKLLFIDDDSCKWLCHSISHMSVMTKLYSKNYVNIDLPIIDISALSLQDLLAWYCIRKEKDVAELKKCINNISKPLCYASLIASLVQLLPYFTSQEFSHLAFLLHECKEILSSDQIYCEYLNIIMPLKKSEGNPVVTSTVQLFIDALLLLKKYSDISVNWPYIIHCLLNVIKEEINNLKNEFRLVTLFVAFSELCRLTEEFQNDENIFCPALHELVVAMKKELSEEHDSKNLYKFLLAALKNIPSDDVQKICN